MKNTVFRELSLTGTETDTQKDNTFTEGHWHWQVQMKCLHNNFSLSSYFL